MLKLKSLPLATCIVLVFCVGVRVQDGSSATYLLKEGAEVNLEFAQDLSFKTAAEDDWVNFELAEDLKVGDVIVAKAGTKAVGTVTHVKKSGNVCENVELKSFSTEGFRG